MASVKGTWGCSVVKAWAESMWLDRRELAGPPFVANRGFIHALQCWLERTAIRMQLGPGGSGWSGGDPEKPF